MQNINFVFVGVVVFGPTQDPPQCPAEIKRSKRLVALAKFNEIIKRDPGCLFRQIVHKV